MSARVTLKVTQGKLRGQVFTFDERTTCLVGRAEDCEPKLPNDQDHGTISRHHCLLDINPPDIRIRDFGSLNGTFVNGLKIGQRDQGRSPDDAAGAVFPEYDLKDGDTIGLGKTEFQVGIYVPTVCSSCSREIPEEHRGELKAGPGVYRCDACRARQTPQPAPTLPTKRCSKCGRDVSNEIGQHRHGEYVCVACRADPLQLIRQLLNQAKSGRSELLAIKGYAIERELGRGGMGAVYLARHEGSGEGVALKVMLPQVAVDEGATKTFLREVENTKALHHANVVQVRDAGCSHGTFFFTLEFCDAGSVDVLVRQRGGKLPLTEAAPLILQTLDGLSYAHQAPIPYVKLRDGSVRPGRGLVHRDLKPQNIFLCRAGAGYTAKVGDFGLAKAFDTAGLSGQTRTGARAGTPVFMPRQQVVNFKYAKPDVDVWAAAASFYSMLTGCFARDFRRDRDIWRTILDMDPVPVRQRDPSIPKGVAEVIDVALREKPQIGFQTAAEFKRALEGVL
ncbi:MAG: FHA domain-containing protein [Rhodopirellula sp.]|nr:FHA domain-containing protein [Rhodopirellula sp.]